MRRSVVVIATITMLVWGGGAAVASQSPTPPTTTTTTPPIRGKPPKLQLTPVDALLARASPDTGELSKRDALRLFAMIFGDVPGVQVSPNRTRGIDATPAVQAVTAHFDEYTPKQQRAIERLLKPPRTMTVTRTLSDTADDSATPNAAYQPATEGRAVFTAARTRASLQQLSDAVFAQFDSLYSAFRSSQRLGSGVQIKEVSLSLIPTPDAAHKNDLGWASPRAGDPTTCEVSLAVNWLRTARAPNTVAHEFFHCLQFAIDGGRSEPDWVDEGSAEYAADEVQPVKDYDVLTQYVTLPHWTLFERSYSAVGFYAHLAETGVNPYKVIPAMLLADSSEAAFAASGATSDEFLDSWAAGYFRGSVPGKDWAMTGPGLAQLSARAKPIPLNLPRDLPHGRTEIADARANLIYRLQTTADVVEVETTPGSRVRVADGRTDVKVSGSGKFCTRPGGCPCAADDVSGGSGLVAATAPDSLVPLQHRASVAITGGTTGSQATLTTYSLANFCCAGPTHAVDAGGLKITPRVGCHVIGLKIQHADPLKLEIGVGLLVDHPRLRAVYRSPNGGKLVGVDLEGINGVLLDFGAGAAVTGVNQNFEVKVPVEVEVPVVPHARGAPASMKVRWTVIVKTAFGSDNSTLWARGRYAFAGPLGVKDGAALQPGVTAEEKILLTMGGITEAPGGIVVAVKTQFVADKGAPKAIKGASSALTASFGVSQGSAFGSPLALCHGASLTLAFSASGGQLANVKSQIFDKSQVVPEGTQVCGTVGG